MELEKQVCSLELAKRLKELGVKQESYFYWMPGKKFGPLAFELEDTWLLDHKLVDGENYAAFTVAELGEMLPHYHDKVGYIKLPDRIGQGKTWWTGIAQKFAANADTEADARAKMLIYLLENGLLK